MNERERCVVVIGDARYEGTSVAPAARSAIVWVWEGWPTARVVKSDGKPDESAAPVGRWIISLFVISSRSGFGTDIPLAGQGTQVVSSGAPGTAFAGWVARSSPTRTKRASTRA